MNTNDIKYESRKTILHCIENWTHTLINCNFEFKNVGLTADVVLASTDYQLLELVDNYTTEEAFNQLTN